MSKECEICRERFGCDRLLYDCPREVLPMGTDDELNDEEKRSWAKTYIKLGYMLPKELEQYV